LAGTTPRHGEVSAPAQSKLSAAPNDRGRACELARELFDALSAASRDGNGITRESYGRGESAALDIIEAKARALGLRSERDAAANLVATLDGEEAHLPFLACGSHLDSVPRAGNFDGAAGVVAGLIVLGGFKQEGFRPRRSCKLFALRGEESARFGKAYVGSSALFGRLSAADLALRDAASNMTLGECMAAVGADVDRIKHSEPLLAPSSIAAWLELHIEQGPILVARQLPVGIVTGIRGNIRHRVVECIGSAGHSGAVPRWLRHDAVFATAELISHLDRHWRTLLERGRDLVITAGVVTTDPHEHAIARIPGKLRFSFELRSQSKETLEASYDLFLSECRLVGEERGVRFELDRRLESAPASMDPGWISRLRAAARALGLPDEEIPSGAGHDAAVFANEGIPSAMIFVRNEHGSHNPQESMQIEDFATGVELMRAALRQAAA
jgi:N-carbamoyl-L-amino-acid hydrolase